MKKTIFALMLLSLMIITSCYKHDWEKMNPPNNSTQPTCTIPDSVSYANDIVPILNASCGTSGSQASSCHGTSGIGGDFTSYSTHKLTQNCDTDSSQSQLYLDITWAPGANNMPQSGAQLSSCDIKKIVKWMDQGYQNN